MHTGLKSWELLLRNRTWDARRATVGPHLAAISGQRRSLRVSATGVCSTAPTGPVHTATGRWFQCSPDSALVNRTTIKIGQESKPEIRLAGFRRGSRSPHRIPGRQQLIGIVAHQCHETFDIAAQPGLTIAWARLRKSFATILGIGDSSLGLPGSAPIILVFFDKTPRYMPLDDSESASVLP